MIDVIVDTNVMLHADNSFEQRQKMSIKFLRSLISCQVQLCVDDGFDPEPGRNRSTIGGEYLQNLQPGSLGFSVVAQLARDGRVKQLRRRPGHAAARKINQLLRNPRDRTFLGVACNSDEKVLVSHDFQDFQLAKRASIRKELGVLVIEAAECDPSR